MLTIAARRSVRLSDWSILVAWSQSLFWPIKSSRARSQSSIDRKCASKREQHAAWRLMSHYGPNSSWKCCVSAKNLNNKTSSPIGDYLRLPIFNGKIYSFAAANESIKSICQCTIYTKVDITSVNRQSLLVQAFVSTCEITLRSYPEFLLKKINHIFNIYIPHWPHKLHYVIMKSIPIGRC